MRILVKSDDGTSTIALANKLNACGAVVTHNKADADVIVRLGSTGTCGEEVRVSGNGEIADAISKGIADWYKVCPVREDKSFEVGLGILPQVTIILPTGLDVDCIERGIVRGLLKIYQWSGAKEPRPQPPQPPPQIRELAEGKVEARVEEEAKGETAQPPSLPPPALHSSIASSTILTNLLLLAILTLAICALASNSHAQTVSSINVQRIGGVLVNGGTGLLVSCPTCPTGSGTQYTAGAAIGGTQVGNVLLGSDGAVFRMLATSAAGRLSIDCNSGCGGASPFEDQDAFTAGTSSINIFGGVFNDGLSAVSSGQAAAPRITAERGLHVNLRAAAGTEIGSASAPLRIDPTGTTPQPVTGTFFQATQPVSGTFFQATQPILAASLPLPAGAATEASLAAISGQLPALLVGGRLSVDGSGVTQPVSGTFFQATQPVSAASLPLPTGASTAAKQPALGTAGTPSADIITIQGAASMTKILVTPDSVALPANQSTNMAQVAGTTTDTNSGNKSAGTIRVVLATDQPALTAKLLVTPDSVALPANQSVNVSQVNGVAPSMGNGASGTGVQRVVIANDSSAVAGKGEGATGAAVPSGAVYMAGQGTANLTGITVCDSFTTVSLTANTQLISGTASQHVRICSINLVAAAATNVALVSGTGTVCATGIAGIAGGSTASTGWNFAANGGIAQGSGLGVIMRTAASGDNVCLLVSAANQISGVIGWTKY